MKPPSTTNYGSLPSTSNSSSFPSPRATSSSFPTCRPWQQFFSFSSFSLPSSYPSTLSRIKQNLSHFRVNYALVTLLILFLSLIYHPYSLIVFLVCFSLWFFLYFFRNGPLVIFNRAIDDRIVMGLLTLLTIVVLCFTNVGLNVLVALIVCVVVIGLHASFRVTEDLFLDEGSAADNGLVSVVRSDQPLMPTNYLGRSLVSRS